MDRLKEKKRNVIEALRASLDAVYKTIPKLTDILEYILTAASNANPLMKTQSMEFLGNVLCKDLTKPEVKQIGSCLAKGAEDSNAEVREAASTALAKLMVIMGERLVGPIVDGLDNSKSQKVRQSYETLKSGISSKPSSAGSTAASTAPKPILSRVAYFLLRHLHPRLLLGPPLQQ